MHITLDEMKKLPFQFFQKTALLQARQLTDADYQLRNGTIQTREGPVGFEPGDYIARGIQDVEWPLTKEHFARSYERVSELDTEGFAFYNASDICKAYLMTESLIIRRSIVVMLT